MLDELKKDMTVKFEMIDIEIISYYLDIGVKQNDNGISISQKEYGNKIL